jgi:hypothetical protein
MARRPANVALENTNESQENTMSDTNTATQTLTIQGRTFTIPAPYTAGPRELTAGEAAALNQTMAENIRNNFAGMMKKAAEGDSPRQLGQAELDEYAAAYKFGERSGGARIMRDPVEAEEHKLATEAVKRWIKSQNKKVKDFTDEQFDGFVTRVVDSKKFRAQAEEIVRVRQRDAQELGDLDLGEAAAA